MNCEVAEFSGFSEWLMVWAPTIWYAAAIVTLWCGSGVLVYRSIMRARHSTGRQWIGTDVSRSMRRGERPLTVDRSVWVFSNPLELIVAALLGPVFSGIAALVLFTTYDEGDLH